MPFAEFQHLQNKIRRWLLAHLFQLASLPGTSLQRQCAFLPMIFQNFIRLEKSAWRVKIDFGM